MGGEDGGVCGVERVMEIMENEDGGRGMGMNHSTIVNVNPIPLHSTFFLLDKANRKERRERENRETAFSAR